MVTVRNIYVDIIRERNIRPLTSGELQPLDFSSEGHEDDKMMSRMLIAEEVFKFATILRLYYKTRPRLELCLKLKYRIPITEIDSGRCFPNVKNEDIRVLTRDYKRVKDKEMFESIIDVFNLYESKQSKSDTLRKWTFVKIDEIVTLLNKSHQAQVYNRDNVGELISIYYNNGPDNSPVHALNYKKERNDA